jgi:hypothetical protein
MKKLHPRFLVYLALAKVYCVVFRVNKAFERKMFGYNFGLIYMQPKGRHIEGRGPQQ